jgi:hypothetical protein
MTVVKQQQSRPQLGLGTVLIVTLVLLLGGSAWIGSKQTSSSPRMSKADKVCSNRYWYDGCKWRAKSQVEKYEQVRSYMMEKHYTGVPQQGVERLDSMYGGDDGRLLNQRFGVALDEVYLNSPVPTLTTESDN